MFAELAAITSAISAINNTIATFKEGKANAQDAASLLGKFGSTAQKLDDWERKKKLKRPLTPKEAMDLSIKRREIKNIETKIKDHLMMAGMSDVCPRNALSLSQLVWANWALAWPHATTTMSACIALAWARFACHCA